jgi:hypothetical protein
MPLRRGWELQDVLNSEKDWQEHLLSMTRIKLTGETQSSYCKS